MSNLASKRCISSAAGSKFTRLVTGDRRFTLNLTSNGGLKLVDGLAATTLWSVAGSGQQGTAQLCLLSNGSLLLTGEQSVCGHCQSSIEWPTLPRRLLLQYHIQYHPMLTCSGCC